jgi:hypothetical protein
LTLSNTSSFLTWSVQLFFCILLQHHISKLSRCFWSTARSVQASAPYKAMPQIRTLQIIKSQYSSSKRRLQNGLSSLVLSLCYLPYVTSPPYFTHYTYLQSRKTSFVNKMYLYSYTPTLNLPLLSVSNF